MKLCSEQNRRNYIYVVPYSFKKVENKSGKLDHGKTVVRRSNLNNWPIQKASAGIRC